MHVCLHMPVKMGKCVNRASLFIDKCVSLVSLIAGGTFRIEFSFLNYLLYLNNLLPDDFDQVNDHIIFKLKKSSTIDRKNKEKYFLNVM